MPKSPQSILRYLKRAALGDLRAEALKKEHWLNLVKQEMPEALAKGCLGCHQNGHVLTLIMASQPLASLMRFEAPRLLTSINRARGTTLSKVSVRVSMDHRPPAPTSPPRRSVSPEVTTHLAQCAEQSSSEEIRDALDRLRKTLESKREAP